MLEDSELMFFRQGQTVAAAFRVIPWEIPTFEELGLPPVMNKIVELEKGFVLVTGDNWCRKINNPCFSYR